VGGVWLVAGFLKLGDPAENVRAVRAFDLLPESLVPVIGHALPMVEIVVGGCLVLGLVTRWAAVVSGLMLVAFIVGISSAWARGMSIDCGCFGGGGGPAEGASDKYPWEIARDVGLLLLSAYLVVRPATPASADGELLTPVPAPTPPAGGAARPQGARAERTRAAQHAAEIRRAAAARELRNRNRVVTLIAVTALIAVVGVGYAVEAGRDTTGQRAAVPGNVVDRYAFAVGADEAPVVVDVYEDFMCPFCGQFEARSGDLVDEYAGSRVRFRYHVISFLDRASSSDYSTRAANALAVVLDTAGPKVAKRFHDALYARQPEEGGAGLSDDQLVSLAVAVGADRSRVEAPIRRLAFAQWVRNATDAASKAGVNQTPTVLVDGTAVSGVSIDRMVIDLRDRIEAGLAA